MPDRLPVSGFVICRDEADRIEACLRSLDQCREIVVVDSGSTDGTHDIVERLAAEGLPVRLIHHDWLGYAAQKQFALDQCSQPWRLSLDADERLDSELRAVLPRLLEASDAVTAWKIPRREHLVGHGYPPASVGGSGIIRLVRAGRGDFDLSARVHEGIVPLGRVERVPQGALLHFRTQTLEQQLPKENRYSSLKARQRAEAGKRARPWRMVASPPAYFLKVLLLRGYWRCGWAGFVFAMNAAVYAYLTEAKTWEAEALARRPNRDEAL